MRLHLGNISKILFLLLALGLSQCAKKTKSQDVQITVAPDSPIVFTSDYTTVINGNTVTQKGPWFQFTVNIQNTADSDLYIMALHVDIDGFDENNQPKSVSMDFTPSQNNFTNDSLTCNYFDFGTFPKKSTVATQVKPTGTGSCLVSAMYFVPTGTPKPQSTALIRYTVKVTPIGYFMDDHGVPSDRFDNFKTIYTQ